MFKCAICGHEHFYSIPSNCRECGAKLNEAKHEELRHLDFLCRELASEEATALMPPEVSARVLAHYDSRRDQVIKALREPPPPAPPEVVFEERPTRDEVPAGPPQAPEKPEPLAVPPEEAVREPERAPAPSEPQVFQPDFAKWGETVMRSLLYLGVAGLICACLLFIYGPKYAVPPMVKLGVLLLITAGIYSFGHVLRYKFDLTRTGLALIFLVAVRFASIRTLSCEMRRFRSPCMWSVPLCLGITRSFSWRHRSFSSGSLASL